MPLHKHWTRTRKTKKLLSQNVFRLVSSWQKYSEMLLWLPKTVPLSLTKLFLLVSLFATWRFNLRKSFHHHQHHHCHWWKHLLFRLRLHNGAICHWTPSFITSVTNDIEILAKLKLSVVTFGCDTSLLRDSREHKANEEVKSVKMPKMFSASRLPILQLTIIREENSLIYVPQKHRTVKRTTASICRPERFCVVFGNNEAWNINEFWEIIHHEPSLNLTQSKDENDEGRKTLRRELPNAGRQEHQVKWSTNEAKRAADLWIRDLLAFIVEH